MSAEQIKEILNETLLILKGKSKKNGKPYRVLVVKNDVKFNHFAIDLLKQQGVEEIDLEEKAEVEQEQEA